ncbi:MAG: hypothetical protein OXN19_16070 [Caldilineaceae bacterium]|nr:hypothetical protein [Caldilineaceae bacterium]
MDWKLVGRTTMTILLVVVVSEFFNDIPRDVRRAGIVVIALLLAGVIWLGTRNRKDEDGA